MGTHRRQTDRHMKLGLGSYQTCGSRRDADLKKWIQSREKTEPLPSRTCGMVQTSNSKVPLNVELDVWTHICPREFSVCLQFLEISHRVVGLINALKENHFPLSRLKELSILGVFKILIDIEKKINSTLYHSVYFSNPHIVTVHAARDTLLWVSPGVLERWISLS